MVELTLYHGDCLEIMKQINDRSIDLIICDLPYGCLMGGAGKEKRMRLKRADHPDRSNDRSAGGTLGGCDWDVKIDLDQFWKQIRRIRRSDQTPTIHFCTTKFGIDLINSNPDEFRYDLVWDKDRGVSFLQANKMPMRSHEMIYVFAKKGAYYHRINENNACVKTVIKIKKIGLKTNTHPTEKPIDLYRWLINRYCPSGGTILDPTFGSGNSVFTAYEIGRNAIGIEKDDQFFAIAEERLNALP